MRRFAAWDGEVAPWLSGDIDRPDCYASFEEFRPDEPAGDWFYWYAEVDYGISGACLCTYRVPPLFDDEHQLELAAGDLILIPKGAVARFEVIGDEPFVHLIVQMPRPDSVAADPDGRSFNSEQSRSDADD